MSLSPILGAEILESGLDGQIETAEVENLMQGVFSSAITGMVVMFSAKMFIKALNPPKQEAEEIIELAELF